jgi:hypothetical protein
MKPESVENLVSDETLRKRIDQILDDALREKIRALLQNKRQPLIEKLSENGLVKIVVSFIVTGILGFLLTNLYQERQARNQARIAGINSFADIVYNRYTRASLLASALRRGSLDSELEKRKEQYDDAYFQWDSSLRRNTFLLRQAQGTVQYSTFESFVQYDLTPLFTVIDGCLTNAYDIRVLKHATTDIVNNALDSCLKKVPKSREMSGYFKAALNCSAAITDVFYKSVNDEAVELIGDDDIKGRCSAPSEPIQLPQN